MNTKLLSIVLIAVVVACSGRARSADSGHVTCIECWHSFAPEKNKAPWWDAIAVGAGGGAVAGSGTGAWVGAGTGVAIGGWGAIPGWYVGAAAGGLAGGTVGGISGAWYRDRQVMCPKCRAVFKNPRN